MKKKNWIGILAVTVSLFLLWEGAMVFVQPHQIQKKIAKEILRFHVLANSDTKEDQEEKMQVKDAVVTYLQPFLENVDSKEETLECVKEQLYNIEETAQKIAGPRMVKVSLEKDWFPAITYGDCTFPAGKYDTLRVEIGEAKGHNWWCVLYPGLCFSSAIKPVVNAEDKNAMKKVLDEESYNFLFHPVKTKIRFRLFGLEFFGKNR